MLDNTFLFTSANVGWHFPLRLMLNNTFLFTSADVGWHETLNHFQHQDSNKIASDEYHSDKTFIDDMHSNLALSEKYPRCVNVKRWLHDWFQQWGSLVFRSTCGLDVVIQYRTWSVLNAGILCTRWCWHGYDGEVIDIWCQVNVESNVRARPKSSNYKVNGWVSVRDIVVSQKN